MAGRSHKKAFGGGLRAAVVATSSRVRSRFTSSHVLAGLALLLAISGGSAVALQGKNRVDSGDIRNGSVRSVDIHRNTIRGIDVREGSLDCQAIPGCGEAGPAGPPGPSGPAGPPGPRGASGSDGGNSSESISYARFFSDQEQVIPPGAAISFNGTGLTNGVDLIGSSTIVVERGGIYSLDVRALASGATALALAIEVNDVVSNVRSGGGGALGAIVLDSLIEIPAGATLRIVNIGEDPGVLVNTVAGATVNSAELDIHRLGSSD